MAHACGSQGDLETALAHAGRMMMTRPDLAEAQAREILIVFPGHPDAELLLAAALRTQNRTGEARPLLEKLAQAYPQAPAVHYEQGLLYCALGLGTEATAALREAVRLAPGHGPAWQSLGDQLTLAGDTTGADMAYAQHIRASVRDPVLMQAADALTSGKFDIAERILRPHLKQHPTDVAAIRMLAELGGHIGRLEEAEKLLRRALELAPGFAAARHHLAIILHRHNQPQAALQEIETLQKTDPHNPAYRMLQASVLARLGEHGKAIEAYREVLAAYPAQPKAWMSLGHTLKAAGNRQDSIAAYRRAIELAPTLGEAYWSLANLKTFRFTAADIAAMRATCARTDISEEDRLHLNFALGKALEDEKDYAAAFAAYDTANALRHAQMDYSADATDALIERLKAQFTAEFFRERMDWGYHDAAPIFVVGLPRSGSTLVEQILASHSQVEGTSELPDIMAIARRLGGTDKRIEASDYPQVLTGISPQDCHALGEEYIARTRIQRKTNRPFFIDKMPNNFLHAGLIKLILPQAKIIDVRRHPLGCCFSCFKQHFARGQGFTYSLTDIGRYYAGYVRLMEHYDVTMPGAVTHVSYEALVAAPEENIRTLLKSCGLGYEEGCTEFYNNPRAVRTASAEQVRQPIYTDGVDHWRAFEPWLSPLKAALGTY